MEDQIKLTEKQEDTLDTVPYDQLLALAKQKTKQSKTLATKNSRLEGKYVEVFKQSKLLKKDQVVFLDFLKMVFEDIEVKQTGSWDIQQITTRWIKRQQQIKQKLETYKSQQQIKIKQIEKLQNQKNDIKPDEKLLLQIKSLQNEIKVQLTNNQILLTQKNRIQDCLTKTKEQLRDISEQKIKIQTQINRVKVNEAQKQLQKTLNTFQDKKEDVNSRTQILLIRQELDRSLQKNDQLNDMVAKLQAKLRNKNKQIQILKQKNEDYLKQQQRQSTTIPSTLISPTVPIPPVFTPIQKQKQKQKQKQIQPFQKQYLKNVYIRFMKSLNDSNYLQAQLLQNVIMTLLEFNNKQRQQIAIRQKAWWNIFQ